MKMVSQHFHVKQRIIWPAFCSTLASSKERTVIVNSRTQFTTVYNTCGETTVCSTSTVKVKGKGAYSSS